jgi:hypothetical protein
MSKTIKISYIWDKETFLKASKVTYDYELNNSNRKYWGWLFIALLQFGVVAAMKKGAVGLLFISTFLVIYWYMLRWTLRKRFILKTFDKSPNANHTYNVEITDEALKIDTTILSWSDIKKVISLKEGFLLFNKDEFFFFPSSAFKDMDERNEFSTIAKDKVTNYIRG